MSKVKFDVSRVTGKIKIMHSVNNVPSGNALREAAGMSTYPYFREAGIPYCRCHDSSFSEQYRYAVDVHCIFRDFSADENDPRSYDFEYTDQYVAAAESVGAKVFYRLGASIEHYKKVGTIPPADDGKWARICEHIIMHYNEGWADGFNYGLEYWEIWNEPHCRNSDGSNPCWQGTMERFYDFFVTVYRHLKTRFPDLKIGGPALCNVRDEKFNHEFFDALKKNGLVLDFFSFHGYHKTPARYIEEGEHAYELLREYGVEDRTKLILNEWNYVRGWTGDNYVYSIRAIKGLKGSSYVAGTMAAGQASHIDHMMYYDARPCTWNGMFDTTFLTPLKGYYPFKMFGELYRLGGEAKTESDDGTVFAVGARGENTAAVMATYFDDSDSAEPKDVEFEFSGLPAGMKKISYYLLDGEHDDELVRCDSTSADTVSTVLKTGLYSTWFIRIAW